VNKSSRTFIVAAVVSIAALASAPLPAADEVAWGPDYVAALPGYSFPSKAYGTTGNGATVSGIFGHNFAPRLSLEFNVQSSTFETGTAGGSDFYQNGFTTDLAYSLWDRHSDHLLIPFVLIGVGGVYDDFFPSTRDGVAFIADAGAGVITRPLFSNGIRFRLDGRYVRDTKEGGHGEGRVIAGIEIPLGRTVRHIERHTEYIVEPARQDASRPEVHEVIAEAAHPWVDSDGDGVDDEHDKCPDTPRGMKVDSDGCVIKNQTFGLQGVTFEFNKARLTPNATYVLDMVSRAFVGQPSLMVEVAGHTDSVGSAEANLKLSQLRAEAVGRYLVSKGASPTQISAKGYGKSQLLVNPETSERDRELNRRVELRVIAQ
jgi:OmpA-OmpF porin, OOP family